MSKSPLSVIIPAFNEEKNIGDCLESVEWADEIIVVDGGSTDRTRQISSQYTPHVITTENAPAETQRLKGLQRIKNEWFFLLDADERVSEELHRQIEEVMGSSNAKTAYYVLRRNYRNGKPVHLHHPDYQLRLFRKDAMRALPERIHRIPKIEREAGRLSGVLVHHFFASVQDYLAKLNKYTAIEASYWRQEKRNFKGWRSIYYLVIRPAGRFLQYYFLKQGFRDGFFGLFFCLSSAFYESMVVALTMGDEP